MTGLFLILLAAAPPPPATSQVARFVRQEFERVGRSAPEPSPELTAAAESLARTVLLQGADEAQSPLVLAERVSAAGGSDPAPRAVLVRGTPGAAALASFQKRTDLPKEPASHLGVATAEGGDVLAIVVVLSDRKATVAPFPRRLPRPSARQRLCARLVEPYVQPELYVSRPPRSPGQAETIERLAMTAGPPGACADVSLPSPGRYTLEIIARAGRGPEVAALFFAQVGSTTAGQSVERPVEPLGLEDARAMLLARVNTLRSANGAAAVQQDPKLDEVAQGYAARMASEGFFAHVAPDGADLKSRLAAAGYAYQLAGENLGQASGPLAAQFAIEHSPGHRKNLLEPAFERIGIGVHTERRDDRRLTWVTQVLALPLRSVGDPLADAYRALDARRATAHLRPLRRVRRLEELAREHLKVAVRNDEPGTELDGRRIHDRVLEAMDDVASTSADFFVADSPALITDSKNLLDPQNDQVGVATVRTDSPRFGPGKYWVLVVYAASR